MLYARLLLHFFVIALSASPLVADPRITWTPTQLSVPMLQGTATSIKVSFTSDVQLVDVRIEVVPELSPFVTVSPSVLTAIPPLTRQEVALTLIVPKATSPGLIFGTIQLKSLAKNNGTVSKPLPVTLRINQPSATNVPAVVAFPSPDRIAVESSIPFVKDEIDIQFMPGTSFTAAQAVIASVRGVILGGIPELNLYQVLLRTADYDGLSHIMSQVATLPDVEFAVHNTFTPISATPPPNDPCTGISYGPDMIRLRPAWANITTGASSVPIGIIDNTFDFVSRDLFGNVAAHTAYSNTLPQASGILSHGTRVASIIGALANNSLGIAGVMWNASLYLYGAQDLTGTDSLSKYLNSNAVRIAGLTAINQGVRVINYSANASCGGSLPACTSQDWTNLNEEDQLFKSLVSYAKRKGRDVLWVNSAGNNYADLSQSSPSRLSATIDTIVSVAAVDQMGDLVSPASPGITGRWGSAYGSGVTVAAPGVAVYSDTPGGGCDYHAEGTSFAAPFVTGVAGLMLSVNPQLTAAEIKRTIQAKARPAGRYDPAQNEIRILDAYAAVTAAQGAQSPSVVYSNFGPGNTFSPDSAGMVRPCVPPYIGPCYPLFAQAFRPDKNYILDKIEIAGTTNFMSSNRLVLAQDSGGLPGGFIEMLTMGSGTNAILSADSVMHPALTAGTQYWIISNFTMGLDKWNLSGNGASGGRAIQPGGYPWTSGPGSDQLAIRITGRAGLP